ncbi:MAG: hypothetical protein SGI86_14825 [Deltaproteobacteria bacterium]|nr:hypothetical protein [Deltaproteobacteria bacterium]
MKYSRDFVSLRSEIVAAFTLGVFVCACGAGSTGDPVGGTGGESGMGGHDDNGGGGGDADGKGGAAAGAGGESQTQGGQGGTATATGGTTGGTGGNAQGGTGGTVAAGGAGGKTQTGGIGGAAPPNADCATLAACETFEKIANGTYPATSAFRPNGSGATFTVVSDKFKSGSKSLKITSPKTGSLAQLSLGGVADLTGGGATVYARMMVFFAPTVIQTTRDDGKAPHWRLIRMIESFPGGAAVVSAGVVAADRGRMLYLSGNADCASDGGTIPANTWACLEMRADASGYQMWIDGKQAGTATTAASGCWRKHTSVLSVGFGLELAAAARVKDDTFWLDDLAISSKRIGCP